MRRIISLILVFMMILTSNAQYIFAEEGIDNDEMIIGLDVEWLTADIVFGEGGYDIYSWPDGETLYYSKSDNLNLPIVGQNGSSIEWSSSDDVLIEINEEIGTIHKPSYSEGYKTVELTAVLTMGTERAEKLFQIELEPLDATPDEQAVNDDDDWLVGETVIHYGIYYNDIRANINLPTIGEVGGSSITWSSSDERWIEIDGTVNRPPFSFALGNVEVILTATISKGAVSKEKTFTLEVVGEYPTSEDNVAIDKAWLTYDIILNGNDANDVKTRLLLPTQTAIHWTPSGNYGGCDIEWVSSNPEIIDVDGAVTRPKTNEGNQEVTLTATISHGDISDTKTFDLVVTVVEEFPLAISYDDFKDTTHLQLNSVSGTVETTDNDGNDITALYFNNDRSTEPKGGSVFTKNKIRLGDDLSFSSAFTYTNPHPEFTTGEGGFVFTLQPLENNVYAQSLDDDSVKPSLNIGFITDYKSSTGSGQETGYYFTETALVYYNGDYENRTARTLASCSTNDPATYNKVWIEYDGTSKTLEVRFSTDELRPVNSNLKIENLELDEVLTSGGESLDTEDVREVYVGFMGSMGNAKDKSEIHNLYFKNDSTPIDFTAYNFIDISNVELIPMYPTGQASTTVTAYVYGKNGPVEGIGVEFSTSLGMLDPSYLITDDTGTASVLLSSTTSGTAIVKAFVPGGATAFTEVQLVLDEGAKLDFDAEWLISDIIRGANSELSNIIYNLYLPETAPNGSTIIWESSDTSLIDIDGEVTRPSIDQENREATLTATISGGTETRQKIFNVTVKVRDEDLVLADKEWLIDEIILNGNESIHEIKSSLYLPTTGENSSAISWRSDKEEIVATNGVVTPPSFTQGNQFVTLTATINMGESTLDKTFNITVIASMLTDEEAVYADLLWLTDDIVLNGNKSLQQVVSKLELPVVGMNGCEIIWESTNEEFVKTDGTINQPAYSQGDQYNTLTATIKKGSSEIKSQFFIKVLVLATDAETVLLDKSWLHYGIIGSVETGLNPPTEGHYGSTISWSSSNEAVIKPDGTVVFPTYLEGVKEVTLTAHISKGIETDEKSFLFLVRTFEQTDEEAVIDDNRRLNVFQTLGGNLSQYSINQDLSLPALGFNGSLITWSSDKPSVISETGKVTIPEYEEGHKKVRLTAIIKKGEHERSRVFEFTVLSKPDTFSPIIEEITPINNGTDILWNTKEITIIFDEDIRAGVWASGIENYGITLSGVEIPEINVGIFKNKLTVNFMDYLKPGREYELIVPSNAITDTANNEFNEEIKILFRVEEKLNRKLEVIEASPSNNERQVSREIDEISLRYSYTDITKGSKFEDISLLDIRGNKIKTTKSMIGGTITLALDSSKSLESSTVYEISIPADAVIDRFENSGIKESIKFITESSGLIPSIESYYPHNGQISIDINQKIIVEFTEVINSNDCKLVLLDDKGNEIRTRIWNRTQNIIVIETLYPNTLKANSLYTIKGPYNDLGKGSDVGFEMSFSTGGNELKITNGPEGSWLPVNIPLEITFSAPISKGDSFAKIKVLDSNNDEVDFINSIDGNKIVMTPNVPLKPDEYYKFYIEKDAVKNQNNVGNSERFFLSRTASRRNYLDDKFYMPSTWVVGKIFTLNARWLGQISNELKSITWDFGDGKKASNTLTPAMVYWHPGDYKVTLTLVDEYGFSYVFEQTITINRLDLSDAVLSVYSENSDLIIFDENNPYGIKNVEPFSISLYSPSIGYISDETINVSLYKNGGLVESLGTVKTRQNGEGQFIFNYGNKGYFGSYELVFELGNSKNVRLPIIFSEATSKQGMLIQLYNREDGEFISDTQDLYFDVNGIKTLGKYEKLYNGVDCYLIEGLKTGTTYSVTLSTSEDYPYESEDISVYHQGSDHTVHITARVKKPGLNYIKSAISDSRPGNRNRGLFIKNVSTPNLYFELFGTWDGLTPGYYEIKSSEGSISRISDKPIFELEPSMEMKEGEELWGRMVSKSGVSTHWVNANIAVAPYPSLGYGPKLDIYYVNGEYVVDSTLSLGDLTGGRLGILDGVPLLDSAKSFGLGGSSNRFDGSISDSGYLDLKYEYGAGHGMNNKKSKILTTGYDVEANITFYGKLHFDRHGSKQWKLNFYIFDLTGRGSYYWKRPYTIPKIDIGGWGKVSMGANIDGRLAIIGGDNDSRDFKGILEFEPYVAVSIGAGIEGKLSVEGYVTGSVPAEFHIPTGYIQVEPNIQAEIVAYYIYDSSTLYSKEIVRTHWDNGKEKVVLFSRASYDEIEEDINFIPTSRNYLDRDTQQLAGYSMMQKNMIGSLGPQIEIIEENIYPRAEVKLISSDNGQWLIWTEDNPVRDDYNRTQLKYSIYRDGRWKDAQWIQDDDTADFAPTIATVEDGILLAWQNISNVMTEENKNESFVKNSEISVTNGVYKWDGSEPDFMNLTDDDKFDHSPMIATDKDKAILVWTKSEGLALTLGEDMKYLESPENSDALYSSVWDGNSWSAAMEVEGSMSTIMDSSLAMHREEAILLYTLDMDNDQFTQEDREIFYRIYDGTVWGEAIHLSNNHVEDSAPKAVNINGEWFVIWYQDGDIMYKSDLMGEAITDEFLSNVPNNYEIAVMEGDYPQIAIVYTNSNSNKTTSLHGSFYDINKGIWSDIITLNESKDYIRAFSPTFTEDGTLHVVYTQAEIITKVVEEAELLVPSDKVDLMMLSYIPKHDLAIEENGLMLMPSIPIKGTTSTISVIVKNQGDFAENASLYLYEGNGSDRKLIGEVSTSEPIPAHSMTQLEIQWLVGLEDKSQYDLYAIVQPELGINEENEDNNSASLKITTADVSVIDLECENIQGDNYLTRARIANVGGRSLENIRVELVNEASREIIESKVINQLLPGQKIDLSFLFSSKDLAKDVDGETNMHLKASLADLKEEYSTENNIYRFILEPATITIEGMDPIQNGTQINVENPLTISFNMNVEQGLDFGEIELIDDGLNEIDLDKVLDGSTLTITPRSRLYYDTGYTLIIPDDAVTDSYGHRMEEAYNLSFVTSSNSPEIVFAYPGNNMTNVYLDSKIMIKFNQEIVGGVTYENIKLYSTDSREVSISTSIEGEWLYINLASNLSEHTEYSLIIPAGALQNSNEDILMYDYELNFETGNVIEDPEKPEEPEEPEEPEKPIDTEKDETDSNLDQPKYNITTDGKGSTIIDIIEQQILKVPFVISVPYTPTGEEILNLESIIISYLDDNGNLTIIPEGYYDSNNGRLIFNVTKFGKFVVSFNKVDFNDVPSDAWYSKAVNFIAARAITSGTGNGNYSPQSKLKRSDFLVLLMRAYNIVVDMDATDNFEDGGNTYYTSYLATAKRLGITKGVGNNMFAPEREITRQEMFVLLYNTLKIIDKLPQETSGKKLSDFTDVEMIDSWANEAIALLVEIGILNGSNGKLLPKDNTIRAEMAQVLYNLLSR